MSIVLNGTTGITAPTYGGTVASEYSVPVTGFKNRIINGNMAIDQRNAGASVTNLDGYGLDRWKLSRGNVSSSPTFNVQQSTTAPPNYKNSQLITVGTSGAPGASNYSGLRYNIEGLNVSDFGWGSATASTVTLSFWVNCSVAGTYGIAVVNSANDRSYIASYTVSAINTWEQKTVTIAGDTSGTWLTTNGIGMLFNWDLGVGTGQSTTAGTWQAGNYLGLTGGTKLSNTGSATFYITGVQLEKGSTATSFDYRPYGTELALCQRYYYRITPDGGGWHFGVGWNTATTSDITLTPFPATMRIAPTALEQSGTATHYRIRHNGSTICNAVPTFFVATTSNATSTFSVAAAVLVNGGASAGASETASGYLGWSAEL